MMRPGPPVEVDAWRWQRSLTVTDSPEGLAQLRLAPEDLAQALTSRADLRVVDAEGFQWPYVFAPARIANLELEGDDGDDAPREITRVETPVALPSLLVAAPPGRYTLLAGNPDAEQPQYEIERARNVVLDLRSVPATAGPGGENPRWTGTPGGSAGQQQRLQQIAIWSAIVIAVLVLGALTLRMVRRPE